MPSNTIELVEQYSPLTGLIYIFNLIVGTGCLTLPAAFASSGWLLSSGGILLLAIISYCTTTWVVESMACANAINHWRRVKQLKKRGQVPDELVTRTLENAEISQTRNQPLLNLSETTSEDHDDQEEEVPLITDSTIERTMGEYYAIQERIEMGQMAKLFYSKGWVKVFYIVLCIYLYGDLAIYEAAVAKSLRDILCTYVSDNCHNELLDSDPCFVGVPLLTRLDMYRLCIAGFVFLMGPFVFCNVSKTKYMQMMTSFIRWFAMLAMITWASVILYEGERKGHPPVANFRRVPELFGVCVYSFMCHHSLPSLITPINEKKSLFQLLLADYLLILLFYFLLAFTGIFAFVRLNDLYTLNFQPDPCQSDKSITPLYCLQVFLLLFPVFTLSTNFPIIAITLRNNLKGLFLRETRRYSCFTLHFLFPLLAVIPPTAVGLITSNVEFLVNVTGAYAGSLIQYVVPATLVYYGRKATLQKIGMGVKNPHKSPLQSNCFLFLICAWALVCQIFVSIYLFDEDR